MIEPGAAYTVKKMFHDEGIFSIRVITFGENTFLLEDLIKGVAESFIKEIREWWGVLFKYIRRWLPEDVDHERLVWIRCSGVPCHAWNDNFFEVISTTLGYFVNCDENTSAKLNMDVSRFNIRTRCVAVINEVLFVMINGLLFRIVLWRISLGKSN